jgi:hypothetical protein
MPNSALARLRLTALALLLVHTAICPDEAAGKGAAAAPAASQSSPGSANAAPSNQNGGGGPSQSSPPSGNTPSSGGMLNAENDFVIYSATAYSLKDLVDGMIGAKPALKGAFVFNLPITTEQVIDLNAMQRKLDDLDQKLKKAEKDIKNAKAQPGVAQPDAVGIAGVTGDLGDIAQAITTIINLVGTFKSSRSSQGEEITEDQDSLNRMLITQLLASGCDVYDFSNNLTTDDSALTDPKLTILTSFSKLVDDEGALNVEIASIPAANNKDLLSTAQALLLQTDTLISTLNGTTTTDQVAAPPAPVVATPPPAAGATPPAGGAPTPTPTPTPAQSGSLLANLVDVQYLVNQLSLIGPKGVELISCKAIDASTSQTNLTRFVGEDQAVISGTAIIDLQILNTKTNHYDFANYVGVRGYQIYRYSTARDNTRLPLCDHTTDALGLPRTVKLSGFPYSPKPQP